MQVFRQSIISTQCDRCARVQSLSRVGVCTVCREILCYPHLHGSFAQRLRVNLFGAAAVCTRCRAGDAPAGD